MIGRFLGGVGSGTRKTYNAVVNQLSGIFVSDNSNNDEQTDSGSASVATDLPITKSVTGSFQDFRFGDGLDDILSAQVVGDAEQVTAEMKAKDEAAAAAIVDFGNIEAFASQLAAEANAAKQAELDLVQTLEAVKVVTETPLAIVKSQQEEDVSQEVDSEESSSEEWFHFPNKPKEKVYLGGAEGFQMTPVPNSLFDNTEGSEDNYPLDPAFEKKQNPVDAPKVIELDSSEESSSDEYFSKKQNQDVVASSTKRTSEVLGLTSNQPAKRRASTYEFGNEFETTSVALPTTAKQPNFFARNPKVTGALIGLGVGLVITAIVAASVFTFGGAAVTAAALAIVLCGCLGAAGLLSLAGALVPSAMNDKRKADEIRAAHTNNLGPVAAPKANKCCVRKPRRETLFGNPTGGPAVVTVVPDADVANMRRVLGTV